MSEKVSAIVTTYKRSPEMVRRAVESVLNQTYDNIEVIVVDDSGHDYELRDKVKEAVLSYGDRVKYIPHEKNMGACAARNTGIDNSDGKYVAFLDDDDVWDEKKTEYQMQKLANPNVGLVYCRDILINEVTGEKTRLSNIRLLRGNVYDEIMKGNFIGGTSFALIKRECFEKCGKFDPLQPAAQDYDLWVRIAEKYEVDYVDMPLVIYYVHAGECITKNPIKRIKAHERLLEKHAAYLKKHPKTMAVRKRYISTLYAQGGRFLKSASSLLYAYTKDFKSAKLNFNATKQSARLYLKAKIKRS